jgi:hypothetical protein
MRKCLIACAAVSAFVLIPVASASAANTVSGECVLNGTATFGSPLGPVPGSNSFNFSGSGSCSGTLNGAAITNAAASASATGSGTLGCTASDATGSGTLTVNGAAVGISFTLVGTASEVELLINGASSGSAIGHATFASGGTAGTACATGGASSLPFTVTAVSANLSG